jgi:hypothetical protein
MWTGVQWSATIPGGGTQLWFTWGWPAAWHVLWYLMATTPKPGAPEIGWDVAVERYNGTDCTYWITVRNLTNSDVIFEGRFAVLS